MNEDTAVVGLPDRPMSDGPQLFRTTDTGRTWSPVVRADIAWVDAVAASGPSLWVLATRWANDTTRRATFLRSTDGGGTWESAALPAQLNDVTHLHRVSPTRAYVATILARRGGGPVFWQTTDGGNTWTSVPTPHDRGLHVVPSSGVRIEQMATAGTWLVVREYGAMFVSHADSIDWSPLPGVEHVVADPATNGMFILTDSLYPALLDHNLKVVWQGTERIPDDVEEILARNGVGYVSLSRGDLYEVREGTLRLVKEGSAR